MAAPLALAIERSVRGRRLTRSLRMEPNPIDPSALQQALIDAVELFRELKIGYALVGGLAAMVYGRAR